MKKYKLYIYIILIIIAIVIGYIIYKTVNKENKQDLPSKTLSEIRYLENNFLSLFNEMNCIKFESYKITTNTIKENETSESSSSSSSQENTSKSSGENSDLTSSQESSNNTSNTTSDKEYNLENSGILTQSSNNIEWKGIKNQVENIYVLLPTITLDLHQIDIDNNKIIAFNTEYDNLSKTVKEENKEQSLIELSILYDYLPTFMDKSNATEKDKIILRTKNNIFKAYIKLDSANWASMGDDIKNATEEYTKLIATPENSTSNQTAISKTYIQINELQNAITLQDKEIFLIKYRNTLEDLENI